MSAPRRLHAAALVALLGWLSATLTSATVSKAFHLPLNTPTMRRRKLAVTGDDIDAILKGTSSLTGNVTTNVLRSQCNPTSLINGELDIAVIPTAFAYTIQASCAVAGVTVRNPSTLNPNPNPSSNPNPNPNPNPKHKPYTDLLESSHVSLGASA